MPLTFVLDCTFDQRHGDAVGRTLGKICHQRLPPRALCTASVMARSKVAATLLG